MRVVRVMDRSKNETEHCIYTADEAMACGMSFDRQWRTATAGQWVLTDDGYVIQLVANGVIKGWRGKNKNLPWVRTAIGTYICHPMTKLTIEPREDRFTITGRRRKDIVDKVTLRSFAIQLAAGVPPLVAFDNTFGQRPYTKNARQQHKRSLLSRALNSDEVNAMLKKEVIDALKAAGITEKWILGSYKGIIENSEQDAPRVSALNALAKIAGLTGDKQGDPKEGLGGKYAGSPAELLQRAAEIRSSRLREGEGLPDRAGDGMTSRSLVRGSLEMSVDEESPGLNEGE